MGILTTLGYDGDVAVFSVISPSKALSSEIIGYIANARRWRMLMARSRSYHR